MGCVCDAGSPNDSLDANKNEHSKSRKNAKKKTKFTESGNDIISNNLKPIPKPQVGITT